MSSIVLHKSEFPLPASRHADSRRLSCLLKRPMDILLSGIALVVVAPLAAVVAVLVKLDSPGPVFYHSLRAGKGGGSFLCYKFRTMVVDADRQKASLQHLNERNGPIFKVSNDPRVTRLGRFLRRYSLDEIPQFWNVLKGEMSLVGPRPHPMEECRKYEPWHFRRLQVTPGLTGLWQITARCDPSFHRNMQLDLEYIEHWSLLLDLRILLRTAAVVLQGTGS